MQFVGDKPMHGFDVVSDRHDRKSRTVKRLRRVARRRRASVAKELGQNQEVARGIECAIRVRAANEPVVTVEIGHVVGGQQNHVAPLGIQRAQRRVDDARFRQDDAAFGVKVANDEIVALERSRRLRSQLRNGDDREQHRERNRSEPMFSHDAFAAFQVS